ncbi:MAG: hypothetical protein HQL30_03620 [Candidatus Omnitrophica bacterium]|nr:hypothetical protein [Candidatus Omnitrophota bacterium]
MPNDPFKRYIVQYRDPVETLVSLYNYVSKGALESDPSIKISVDHWHSYLLREVFGGTFESNLLVKAMAVLLYHSKITGIIKKCLRYNLLLVTPPVLVEWKRFMRKWVVQNKNPKTVFIPYQSLIERPYEQVWKVISFIAPSEKIDPVLLKEICDRTVNEKYDIKRFRYYDAGLFDKLYRKSGDLVSYA